MGPPVVFLLIALIFGAGFALAPTVFSFGDAERSQRTPSTEQVSEVEAEKRAILQEARDALEAGAAERAVRLLNDALATYPDSPEIFLDLALALHQTNRKKEARKALNTYRVLKGKEAE